MEDNGRWEVASAKPMADRAPEPPRMEDDGNKTWAETRKTSVRAGGGRRPWGRWEVAPAGAKESR